MYFRQPKTPDETETELINQLAQLASIAIESTTKDQALRKSEERFNLAMQAANDGLWDWNLQTNLVYYSPRWKSMLGYEDHELTNDFSAWEQLVASEDKIRTLELVEQCKTGQRDSFTIVYRLQHKQGHWLHILAKGLMVCIVAAINRHIALLDGRPYSSASTSTNNTVNEESKIHIPSEADDIIDWPAIQIRYQGNDRIIRKLITTLLRTHKEAPENLRQAVLNKDIETLHSISHNLKAISGYLEAHKLHKLSKRVLEDTMQNNTNIHLGVELADAMDELLAVLPDQIPYPFESNSDEFTR